MKVSAPHRGWTSGRATPSLRPTPYAAKTANPAGRHLSFAEICPDDRGQLCAPPADWPNPSEPLKELIRIYVGKLGARRASAPSQKPTPTMKPRETMDASAPNVLNPQQASALLAGGPFAAALAEDAALVIATGHPARIAFATPAGLAMFRADDLAALEAAVVGAQSPGARRLRQLAQSLAIGGAPRMEQLRFFSGRSPILLGLR